MKAALAKFYDGSVIDAAVTIPEGKLLKPGMQDERVTRVEVKIVKLAIADGNEEIGITLVRNRA